MDGNSSNWLLQTLLAFVGLLTFVSGGLGVAWKLLWNKADACDKKHEQCQTDRLKESREIAAERLKEAEERAREKIKEAEERAKERIEDARRQAVLEHKVDSLISESALHKETAIARLAQIEKLEAEMKRVHPDAVLRRAEDSPK